MTTLVTGCAGFIGSHVCEALLRQGETVVGVDNMNDYYDVTQKEQNLEILTRYPSFTFVREDIVVSRCIDTYRPRRVCHLASRAGVRDSLKDPTLYCRNNVEGQVNLLEQAVKCGVQLFVYASSSSVYGLNTKVPFSETDPLTSPNSAYACSKVAMEVYGDYYHRLYGIPVIGLRFFTVYGPRGRPDMAPYKFVRDIMEGTPIVRYGDGTTMRDYTYIDDIVSGILASLRSETSGVYNLGNGAPISLNMFIATCEKVVGKRATITEVGDQKGDVPLTYADIEKARRDLNYEPKTGIEEGLRKLYEWLIDHRHLVSDSV